MKNGIDLAAHEKFMQYMEAQGKSYGTLEEYEYRLELFMQKDAKINAWNSRSDVTHVLGHNMFSDMNDYETK